MKRVIWSNQSAVDLFAIHDRYCEIDPALADEVLWRIEHGAEPVARAPFIGSPVTISERKWRAPHTPFLFFYSVGEDSIQVVRVRHVRSDWRP